MAKIVELDLSKEDYLEIARNASNDGQVEKAIINLNKALRLDNKYLDAALALSNIYLSIHDVVLSDRVIYNSLQYITSKREINKCYNQLANNHIAIKDMKTAEYYLVQCEGDFIIPDDIEMFDFDSQEEKGYSLYDKDGIDENAEIIDKAYVALRERRLEDVIMCADKVSEKSPLKKTADYLVLITLMLKENFQGVIDNGKMIVEKRGESLQILSTMATAYWLMEQKDEAYKVIDHILEKQYTKEEDVLQLLPLLVNTGMHVNVVQYTKLALNNVPYQKDIMMWCAEGLYNIGQIKESKKMFNSIKNIFNDSVADFYLKLINQKPDYLEYSITLPTAEKTRRFRMLKDLVKGQVKKISYPIVDEDIIESIDWLFEEGNVGFLRACQVIINNLPSQVKDEMLRRHMLDSGMSFDQIVTIFSLFIDNNVFDYEFNIVAQERFKHIKLKLPKAFFVMPETFRTAVSVAISEIIQADEQADEYVQKLINGLDKVMSIENDDICPKNCTPLQLKRIKSIETIVGVIIAYTYKDEVEDFDVSQKGDFAIKHGLDEKKFDKYYNMIYGEEYDY